MLCANLGFTIVEAAQLQHPTNKYHQGILHSLQSDVTHDGWLSVGQDICKARHQLLRHLCYLDQKMSKGSKEKTCMLLIEF
jgi:hypothetical protein